MIAAIALITLDTNDLNVNGIEREGKCVDDDDDDDDDEPDFLVFLLWSFVTSLSLLLWFFGA
jgi:hypothetical protein